MREYRRELDCSAEAARSAVGGVAEEWDAEWSPDGDGGELTLPVVYGLRRGFVRGRVALESRTGGSRVSLRVHETRLRLNAPAVGVLVFGAAGGLAVALWPFFPELLAVAPVGVVLAIVAWLLVASRLRTSGPEEFLEQVGMSAGSAPAA